MNKPETVTEAKRNTLIRAAVGMLQHERTAAIAIEMPGEPESFIAIGTAADIARALPEIREAAPASHPARRQRRGDRPTEPLSWEGESAAPAAASGDAQTDLLAPMSVADAMRIVKANWGDMTAIEEAFTANAARIERAAAPAPSAQITIAGTQEAREYVDAWHRKHFPTDRTFTRYIMNDPARSNPLAGDFAWQLANALQEMEARAAAPATASGDERAMFEHAERASDLTRDDGGDYANPCVQSAWEGWRARAAVSAATKPAAAPDRNDILEEAAKLCEEMEGDMFDQYKGRGKHAPNNPYRADPYMNGQSDGAGQCAIGIRKLMRNPAAAPAAPTAAPAEQVRNQALEEAASAAESTPIAKIQHGLSLFQDGDGTRKNIATAIRALKSAPDGAQGEGA